VSEDNLDAREFRVMVREDADCERANQVEKIKTAADKRDEQLRLVTWFPASAIWPLTSMPGCT
jgi:hypothetical protein